MNPILPSLKRASDDLILPSSKNKRIIDILDLDYYRQPLAQCGICLDEYNLRSIAHKIHHLPCFHFFHELCLEPWLANNTCPICRHIITVIPSVRRVIASYPEFFINASMLYAFKAWGQARFTFDLNAREAKYIIEARLNENLESLPNSLLEREEMVLDAALIGRLDALTIITDQIEISAKCRFEAVIHCFFYSLVDKEQAIECMRFLLEDHVLIFPPLSRDNPSYYQRAQLYKYATDRNFPDDILDAILQSHIQPNSAEKCVLVAMAITVTVFSLFSLGAVAYHSMQSWK